MRRHRFLLLIAGALLLLPAAGRAADEPDDQDTIPISQIPEQAAPEFDKLRTKFTDSVPIVDRTQKLFNQAIIKTNVGNVSPADMHFVGRVLGHVFEHAKEYQRIINDPNLSDKERNQQLAEVMRHNEAHRQADLAYAQRHNVSKQVSAAVVGPASSNGSGMYNNAKADGDGHPGEQFDQDRKTIAQVATHAVREAFHGAPPGNAPNAPNLGAVLGDTGSPSDPSSAMSDAGDNLLKGNLQGAVDGANKAVELGGGAPALAMRGGLELDKNQFSAAAQDARHALELDPTNKDAQAIAHFAEGRVDGVATGGPEGAKGADAPAGASGGANGGGEAGGSGPFGGRGGEAASLSASAGGASGLSAGGGGALARMSGEQARKAAADALSMGDLGGALAFVSRALAQNPRDPSLLNLRSMIRARQRDYAGAEADAKAGLALAPRDSALLRSLGFAQLREKDYEAAIATANKMLELNPNDPYAYAIRGHAYGSLGDRDAMMADLKRAAELDPSFRDAAERLGGELQLPSDKDILFLFPGETAASPAKTAAPAPGRGRSFGLLVGASALGGLLLALGLLATVLAPLKERVTSVFTRLTRTGPTVGSEPADAAAPASVNGHLPGLIRGQYEVSREIGSGGMVMVFSGVDRALGRPVAIKKMRDELRHDAREQARFVAEAKTVAALHHPNIVDIYAIAEDGGDVFLIFEYVEGRTVHELLTGGKLAPAEAARVVRASAEALEYAHGRGVVHRDMKPSNVMIDRSGAVKVMDFGIARMAKDTMLRQSAANTVAGTPPYMAPEQEQGRARAESDVYSLAVCAYEMLTGKLPFTGSDGGMLLNKINMSFVSPSRQSAGLPEALDGVFERAFQADPEKRYRTARDFASALETAALAAAKA